MLNNACYVNGIINEINETYVNPYPKGEVYPLYENFSVCCKRTGARKVGQKCNGHEDYFMENA